MYAFLTFVLSVLAVGVLLVLVLTATDALADGLAWLLRQRVRIVAQTARPRGQLRKPVAVRRRADLDQTRAALESVDEDFV